MRNFVSVGVIKREMRSLSMGIKAYDRKTI